MKEVCRGRSIKKRIVGGSHALSVVPRILRSPIICHHSGGRREEEENCMALVVFVSWAIEEEEAALSRTACENVERIEWDLARDDFPR